MSEHILTHKHHTHTYAASGWRIHCGVEVTELSTNKQHTLTKGDCEDVELHYSRDVQDNKPRERTCDDPSFIVLTETKLFIGTQFSNLYTAVDTSARGHVVFSVVYHPHVTGTHVFPAIRKDR